MDGNAHNDDSEDDDDYHENDYEDEADGEDEESSEGSSVDRHEKPISRRSVSDESWMNPALSTTTSSMPFVETSPSFPFSQSPPYNHIPCFMPELDLPNDTSCWDSMMGVAGPETTPSLLQELEKSTCIGKCFIQILRRGTDI
jgi:hypothetical protein